MIQVKLDNTEGMLQVSYLQQASSTFSNAHTSTRCTDVCTHLSFQTLSHYMKAQE